MSETADDDEDLEHPRFIRMRAVDTFDGQERVFTRAAYDLQVQATAHSGRCGHPGYVPDDYLEHLDGLGIETTVTAAELCAIGTWERVGGGYRVLDWEAVEFCLDLVRQDNGEDPRALAWDRSPHRGTPVPRPLYGPPGCVPGRPQQNIYPGPRPRRENIFSQARGRIYSRLAHRIPELDGLSRDLGRLLDRLQGPHGEVEVRRPRRGDGCQHVHVVRLGDAHAAYAVGEPGPLGELYRRGPLREHVQDPHLVSF
jgi:hypothetical protein